MKYIQVKSFKINNLVIRNELKRKFYKSIFLNVGLPLRLRHFAFYSLMQKKRQESISMFRGRCMYTYRSRAVLNFFKQSRMQFRYFASFGLLPGVRKSSW